MNCCFLIVDFCLRFLIALFCRRDGKNRDRFRFFGKVESSLSSLIDMRIHFDHLWENDKRTQAQNQILPCCFWNINQVTLSLKSLDIFWKVFIFESYELQRMKCGPEFVNKNGDRHKIFSLLHKKPNNKALHRTATAELFICISCD